MKYKIPFNKPSIVGKEIEYVQQAVANGHISGAGPFTRRAEQMLEKQLGAPRVLLTTSCTDALEMAGMLLDKDVQGFWSFGIPSFGFVSIGTAFCRQRWAPQFFDIREDTLNINLETGDLGSVAFICAINYAGILSGPGPTHQNRIEDNAHGLFASHNGKPLGTFGRLATLSFHETKNITCGEGGALVINDPSLIERAEIIRDKGTNRGKFLRGEVDKYTWCDQGSSFLPSDILAAFLCAQLEKADEIQERRLLIWWEYHLALKDWAANHDVREPSVPLDCKQSYHMYYLLMPSLDARTRFIDHMKARGILAVSHYQPLHLSPMGHRYGARKGQCPVSERVADTIVRLPMFYSLKKSEQSQVIEAVRSFEEF